MRKFILILVATLPLVSFGRPLTGNIKSDEVFARNYGAPSYATLTNAIAKIGSAEKTLVIDGGEWEITSDVTVPANIRIELRNDSAFTGTGTVTALGGYYPRLEYSDEVFARDFGAPSYATFTNAIGIIGSAEKTLVIDGGEWAITSDVVVPSNVSLDVRTGSYFSGAGQITGLSYARPEWWGAIVDDGVADNDALESAILSSKFTELSEGEYNVSRELFFNQFPFTEGQHIIVSGNSKDSSIIKRNDNDIYPVSQTWVMSLYPTGAVSQVNCTDFSVTFNDLCIDAGYNECMAAGYTNCSYGLLRIAGQGHSAYNSKFRNFGAGVSAGGAGENFPISYDPLNNYYTGSVSFVESEFCDIGDMSPYLNNENSIQLIAMNGPSFDESAQTCLSNSPPFYPESSVASICHQQPKASILVRDCVFHDLSNVDADGNRAAQFVSLWPIVHGVVDGNFVYDCDGVTLYLNDTYKNHNLIFRNNIALDVFGGWELVSSKYFGSYSNVVIENNYITYYDSVANVGAHHNPAVDMTSYRPMDDYAMTNVAGSSNFPIWQDITVKNNVFKYGRGVTAGSTSQGTIESRLRWPPYQYCNANGLYNPQGRLDEYRDLVASGANLDDVANSNMKVGTVIKAFALTNEVYKNIRFLNNQYTRGPTISFFQSSNLLSNVASTLANGTFLTSYGNYNSAGDIVTPFVNNTEAPFNQYQELDKTHSVGTLYANTINGRFVGYTNTPKVFNNLLTKVDGGFGDFQSWTSGVPLAATQSNGSYSISTTNVFCGRFSGKMTVVADTIGQGVYLRVPYGQTIDPPVESNTYYSFGGMFYCDYDNTESPFSTNSIIPLATIFSYAPEVVVTNSASVVTNYGVVITNSASVVTNSNQNFVFRGKKLEPRTWTPIVAQWKPEAGTTNLDLRWGVIADFLTTNSAGVSLSVPTGTTVYVDNAFVAKGYYESFEAFDGVEAPNFPNATNYAPRYIGEEVYVDGKWYKASGLSVTNWLLLN